MTKGIPYPCACECVTGPGKGDLGNTGRENTSTKVSHVDTRNARLRSTRNSGSLLQNPGYR